MMGPGPTPSRRRFLGTMALPLAAGRLPSFGPSPPRRVHGGGSFDPTVQGFGFQNWPTTVPTVLTGTEATDYTLEAHVAGVEGELLSASQSARIGGGEVREYEAVVPASPDDQGSLEPVAHELPLTTTGALAAGAAGAATGAYALWRRSGD